MIGQYTGVAGAAAVMFAGTNIDDAVVLTAFNVSARSVGAPTQRQIWAGQFLGMALTVLVSVCAALGLRALPAAWVGLLGIVPLAMGIHLLAKMIRTRRRPGPAAPALATGVASVVLATIAGGADNIAVYTPAFRVMGPAALALTLLVFAVGTAVWCLAGYLLIARPRLLALLHRCGTGLTPVLFIALGLYLLGAALP